MPIGELTSREAVERALDEFDELGREAFLERYGYGHAKTWFVERDGKLYDSKAIAGAARWVLASGPWPDAERRILWSGS